jgi:DNA-binding response OmpR family regulator
MSDRKAKISQKEDKPLILIAEDNPVDMRLLCKILKKDEPCIAMAGNGKQALEMVPLVKPDLILLDILMPKMNGLEVCKQLQASPETRDIPIIFLSAKDEVNDVIEGLQAGAVDYVTKPFNATELITRVRNHIKLTMSIKKLARINTRLEEAYNVIENESSAAAAVVKSLLTDIRNG